MILIIRIRVMSGNYSFQFCCEGKGDEAEQKKRWAEAIAFQDERYVMRLSEKTDGAVAGKLIMEI